MDTSFVISIVLLGSFTLQTKKFSYGPCDGLGLVMNGESGLCGGQCYWHVGGLPGFCVACQLYKLACIGGL